MIKSYYFRNRKSPGGVRAKLRTVAASNNRVHTPWLLYYCLFAPHICAVVLRARGESHIQCNTSGEVATLQTTQTYYFKRLLSYHKPFSKFFRKSNALKQQRFSHQVKATANIFKQTSLANIISYPIKPFSWSTLFIKVSYQNHS